MMGRFVGVFACIPATVLLTISFFVLVVNRRVESHPLKVFGYVVTAFLWVSAAVIAMAGLITIATGRLPCSKLAHRPMACMQSPDAVGLPMTR